jgi:hypothetical protein
MSNSTVPGPLPDSVSTRTHAIEFATVHVQSASVESAIETRPPVWDTRATEPFSSNVQGAGACAIVMRASFSTIAPLRGKAAPF